jgi:hypothetical protein
MSTTPRVPSAVADQAASFRTVFAHQPAVFAAFDRLYAQLWSRGIVAPETKEVARLRNARRTDCGF